VTMKIVISCVYLCVHMAAIQMTAMMQGNRDLRREDTLSRTKTCRVLPARQELELKGNRSKDRAMNL
jgi:hypothetical protein